QFPADEPLRIRRVPLQDRVPLRLPLELLGPRGPVRLAPAQRLRPHGRVVGVRLFPELVRRREGTVFLEQRVDLVSHERGFYAIRALSSLATLRDDERRLGALHGAIAETGWRCGRRRRSR